MQRSSARPRLRPRDADGLSVAVPAVTDESLVVRNYDARAVRVHVRFVDADDEAAFDRTYALGPGDVVSTPARLQRGVYRVTARLVAAGESDGVDEAAAASEPADCGAVERDAADCLVGSAPAETAVVETGNGVVSVAEGLV